MQFRDLWVRTFAYRLWKERHEIREREGLAEEELEKSRQLLEEDRAAAGKLARENRKNQFSEMIRDALAVGYEHPRRHEHEGGRGTT